MPQKKYIVLMPCFADWDSAANIIKKFSESNLAAQLQYIIVNDSGTMVQWQTLPNTKLINLKANKGHQSAIAIGLSYCVAQLSFDGIIVMDADGQDNYEDAVKAMDKGITEDIIYFKRSSRKEALYFKLMYKLYLFVARLLTGKSLQSGNFSIITNGIAKRIVQQASLYTHYNATLQLLPHTTTLHWSSERLSRQNGQSTMRLYDLIVHGLSALYAMSGIIAARIFFWSGLLLLSSIVGLLVVFGLKFFSDATLYGWSSTVSILLFIILLFSILLCVVALLLYKNTKHTVSEAPIASYEQYINDVTTY